MKTIIGMIRKGIKKVTSIRRTKINYEYLQKIKEEHYLNYLRFGGDRF